MFLDPFSQLPQPVNMAGDQMPPEPIGEPKGSFEVDCVTHAAAAERGSLERFRAELKIQTGAVDCHD